MNGGDHLIERDAAAAERGIEPEHRRETLVDGELVGADVPHPGADDRAGIERELDALDILARDALAGPERVLGAAARADVAEQNRDLTAGWGLQPGRGNFDMAIHGREILLEAGTLARQQHVAIELQPHVDARRVDLAQRLADDVADAGMALIARIGLDMDIVAHRAMRPIDEFDDAEAVVDGVE